MRLRGIDRTSDETGAGAKREGDSRHRARDRSPRRRRRACADPRGGRSLALGQPVGLVVEQQDLQVHVAPQNVQQVVAADRQTVAVAGYDPDVELRIGKLDSGGNRRRAAVDRVESVTRDVIGKTGGAADTRDEHGFFRGCADLGQGLLHRLENGVIAAARTPSHFLVRGKILGRKRRGRGYVIHLDPASRRQAGADCRLDFGDSERCAGDVAQAFGRNKIFAPQQHQ